jgi:hypothetical protein
MHAYIDQLMDGTASGTFLSFPRNAIKSLGSELKSPHPEILRAAQNDSFAVAYS